MKIPFTGGCACGAIRYEASAEPVMMQHCHCGDCQRSSGGPFSSYLVVPTKGFKLVQGEPRFYGTTSTAGGKTRRGFCGECGSPLEVRPDAAPEFVAIRAGSLDDPSGFSPQMDAWTCDAQPWDFMNPALAKFEQYPTGG